MAPEAFIYAMKRQYAIRYALAFESVQFIGHIDNTYNMRIIKYERRIHESLSNKLNKS